MSSDTTCVIYCRVSSERQAKEDKGSLDAQEANGLGKARELGLRVLYTVKDAESAWILDKRSRFQAVLNDAKAGKFSVMIVDRMNRLTRSEDLAEYMAVMTTLREAGVTLVFADKTYEDSRTGQLQAFIDAYVSAGEQDARRKQSLQGKRNKVLTRGLPNPGSWASYGWVWVDSAKTRMDFDDGESSAIVRRIWRYFLTDAHPTLAGMAKRLNREGVKTPREYRGIRRGSNALAGGPRWTAVTIRDILRDERMWGGDEAGTVPTFRYAEHNEVARIPAYGPAFVTRAEAERVHTRIATNARLSTRNRKYARDTLLHGGLAKCGYCGWSLSSHTYGRPRADGSLLTIYRCQQNAIHGTKDCRGVTLSAETLDTAVLLALDEQIHRGDFLQKIFDAWEADGEAAMASVRSAETTLKETEAQISNLMARIATYAPGDPLSAPAETHARMLADTVPGLRERVSRARSAVETARRNPELRAQLASWFDSWLGGVWMMSRAAQREFLASLNATVRLWRAEDRTPRAVVEIGLPTSALRLPTAPDRSDSPLQRDPETGAWTLSVDTAEAARMVADARGVTFVGDTPPVAAEDDGDVEAIMRAVVAELVERGYSESAARRLASIGYGGPGPTSTVASSSSCAAPMSRV